MKVINKICLCAATVLLVASCGCNSKKKDLSVKFQELDFDAVLNEEEKQKLLLSFRESISSYSSFSAHGESESVDAINNSSAISIDYSAVFYDNDIFNFNKKVSYEVYENGVSFNEYQDSDLASFGHNKDDVPYRLEVKKLSRNSEEDEYSYALKDNYSVYEARRSILDSFFNGLNLDDFMAFSEGGEYFLVYSIKDVEEEIQEEQEDGTNIKKRKETDRQTIFTFESVANKYRIKSFTNFYELRTNYDNYNQLYYSKLTVADHRETRLDFVYDSTLGIYNGNLVFPNSYIVSNGMSVDAYGVSFDEEDNPINLYYAGTSTGGVNIKQINSAYYKNITTFVLQGSTAYKFREIVRQFDIEENDVTINDSELALDNLEAFLGCVDGRLITFEGETYLYLDKGANISINYSVNGLDGDYQLSINSLGRLDY